MNTVKHIIVVGGGDDTPLHEAPHATLHRYEDLLSSESPGIEWPVLDERAADQKDGVRQHRLFSKRDLRTTKEETTAHDD